jgi:hypothetical protein
MSVYPDSLDDISDETFETVYEDAKRLIAEGHPNASTKTGVINDVVLLMQSEISSAGHQATENIRVGFSKDSLEDSVDTELTDKWLENYNVVRSTGSLSTGKVMIVISTPTVITIQRNAEFRSNGLVFYATSAFSAKLDEGNVISDTDRLITQLGTDRYGFVIDVEAADVGTAYNLRRGDAVVPVVTPRNYVEAYVSEDFSDGTSTETNAEVKSRLTAGIAAQCASNRLNMLALTRAQDGFEEILAISYIGFGDPEMYRDKFSVFPGSMGGRADVYVRPQSLPNTTTLEVTATYMGEAADGSLWQFSLDRDVLPGFYDVVSVVAEGEESVNTTGYEVTEILRQHNFSTDTTYPSVVDTTDAAFSRYQTAIVTFVDENVDTTSLEAQASTATYSVTVRGMPLIEDLQEFYADRDFNWPSGDCMVKAALPCDVQIGVALSIDAEDEEPDEATIKQAICDYINGVGFNGTLHASKLYDIVHNYIGPNSTAESLNIVGKITHATGNLWVQHTQKLTIPDRPELGVTANTTVFIAEVSDVFIGYVND